MSARHDIATAASTVDGITAHPYYVQATHPGHAFVRLDRVAYPNPFGGVAHWNVVVMLPQDIAAAEQYVEQMLSPLREAIGEHLVVTEVVMQRLNIPGAGDLPCVFINGHREED